MIPKNKTIHIFAGGTVFHIAPHLGLTSEAFGQVGRDLERMCREQMPKMDTILHSTRMATGGQRFSALGTNADVEAELASLVEKSDTKIIIMAAALCDYDVVDIMSEVAPVVGGDVSFLSIPVPGKYGERLKSRDGEILLKLRPAKKLLPMIRKERKDIFLIGFAATAGDTAEAQYEKGLRTLKESSANLVLSNDVHTMLNMVIVPEEAFYHRTTNRFEALRGLVEMIALRSQLTFTQSTVVAGDAVSWNDDRVAPNLRRVVDHFIDHGAYKPFNGNTAGHFAQKVDDQTFLTSRRKSNFNELGQVGLVLVKTDGPDTVLAYGAKPSVGGQSQRIVFKDHPGYECIVHAHVPLRPTSKVPVRSQREYECGSHQCGKNTSEGLMDFGDGILAVYLENHGPNIVFRRDTDPEKVIAFAEANFDLASKTGMPVWDGHGHTKE